jgi:hypothetical protein
MKNIHIFSHGFYHLAQFLILLAGFAILLSTNLGLVFQTTILLLLLAFYTSFGIIHHRVHHDLNSKIVIEYIVMSLLVFAGFLFLNIGRF